MSFATGAWLDLRSTVRRKGARASRIADRSIRHTSSRQDAARRGLPNLQPRVIPARHMACSCDVEFPPPTPHSLRWRQVMFLARPTSCGTSKRSKKEKMSATVFEVHGEIQYRRNESIFNARQARQLPKRYCAFTPLVTHLLTTKP